MSTEKETTTSDERLAVLTALSNYNWTLTNCVIKLFISSMYEFFNENMSPKEIETLIKDYYREGHNIASQLCQNDPTFVSLVNAGLVPKPNSDEVEKPKLKLTYNSKPIKL
jgi:hypothetical protein